MLFVLIVNATAASEGHRRKSMELHYGSALASIAAEERVQSHTPFSALPAGDSKPQTLRNIRAWARNSA